MAGTGDEEGSGKMMGVVVFASMFVILFALFQSMFISITPGSTSISDNVSPEIKSFDASTLVTYQFFNTTGGGNLYNITADMYGTEIDIPANALSGNHPDTDATELGWDVDGTGDGVYMYPLKDWTDDGTYRGDSFVIWDKTGWFDSNSEYITKSMILQNLQQYTNYQQSKVSIHVGLSFSVFFTFPKEDSVSADLDARSGFSVAIGQSELDQASDKSDMIGMVTDLLTFNVNTGNQYLDILIVVPIGIAYVWIGIWLLTRIIGAFMP